MSIPRRRFVFQAVVVALALVISSVAAYAGSGAVTTDLLNVRKEPSQDAEIKTKLARDAEFRVADIKGEWYQIKYGEENETGWVMAQYVKAVFNVVQIASDGVNARANPSTEANVLARLDQGEKYFVVGTFNNWFKIKLATGETAWVIDEFAKVIGTATRGYDGDVDTRDESTIGGVSEPPKPTSRMQIKGDNVNFRANPNLDADIMDQLADGIVVTVLEGFGEWRRIKTPDGSVGYVNKMFLEEIKAPQVAVANGGSSGVTAVSNSPQKTTTVKKTASSSSSSSSSQSSSTAKAGNGQSKAGNDLVSYAKQFMGIRYKWGGTTTKGFDCSGFTQYVMRHFGVSIPRTSKSQSTAGKAVKKADLRTGDIVYFAKSGTNRTVNHVGIYIGSGNFIHSSSGGGGKGVTVSNLNSGSYAARYAGARRYLK